MKINSCNTFFLSKNPRAEVIPGEVKEEGKLREKIIILQYEGIRCDATYCIYSEQSVLTRDVAKGRKTHWLILHTIIKDPKRK